MEFSSGCRARTREAACPWSGSCCWTTWACWRRSPDPRSWALSYWQQQSHWIRASPPSSTTACWAGFSTGCPAPMRGFHCVRLAGPRGRQDWKKLGGYGSAQARFLVTRRMRAAGRHWGGWRTMAPRTRVQSHRAQVMLAAGRPVKVGPRISRGSVGGIDGTRRHAMLRNALSSARPQRPLGSQGPAAAVGALLGGGGRRCGHGQVVANMLLSQPPRQQPVAPQRQWGRGPGPACTTPGTTVSESTTLYSADLDGIWSRVRRRDCASASPEPGQHAVVPHRSCRIDTLCLSPTSSILCVSLDRARGIASHYESHPTPARHRPALPVP